MFSYYFGSEEGSILRSLNDAHLGFLADLGKAREDAGELDGSLFKFATFSRPSRNLDGDSLLALAA